MRLRGGGGRLRKMGKKMWWKRKEKKKGKEGEEKGEKGEKGRCERGGQVEMGWDGMGWGC